MIYIPITQATGLNCTALDSTVQCASMHWMHFFALVCTEFPYNVLYFTQKLIKTYVAVILSFGIKLCNIENRCNTNMGNFVCCFNLGASLKQIRDFQITATLIFRIKLEIKTHLTKGTTHYAHCLVALEDCNQLFRYNIYTVYSLLIVARSPFSL